MAYFIDSIEYTEEEYNELRKIINNRPMDTFETVYFLNHDTKMYEGRDRTHDEVVDWYVQVVQIGTVKLEEVPEEYRTEVESRLNEGEATAEDYLNALSDLGVAVNE